MWNDTKGIILQLFYGGCTNGPFSIYITELTKESNDNENKKRISDHTIYNDCIAA